MMVGLTQHTSQLILYGTSTLILESPWQQLGHLPAEGHFQQEYLPNAKIVRLVSGNKATAYAAVS
jgi:hypothetical protein